MNIRAFAIALGALLLVPGAAQAEGDATAGKTVFSKCMVCHSVGENAKNKVGPVLNDVFGRTAGTLPDFRYSAAMVAAGEGGLVWTPETIAPYVHSPKETVPGNKMVFAGLKKQEDIDNVIAYLLTFSPDYVPAEGEAAPAAAPAQ